MVNWILEMRRTWSLLKSVESMRESELWIALVWEQQWRRLGRGRKRRERCEEGVMRERCEEEREARERGGERREKAAWGRRGRAAWERRACLVSEWNGLNPHFQEWIDCLISRWIGMNKRMGYSIPWANQTEFLFLEWNGPFHSGLNWFYSCQPSSHVKNFS